jgi:hypothetical protein
MQVIRLFDVLPGHLYQIHDAGELLGTLFVDPKTAIIQIRPQPGTARLPVLNEKISRLIQAVGKALGPICLEDMHGRWLYRVIEANLQGSVALVLKLQPGVTLTDQSKDISEE